MAARKVDARAGAALAVVAVGLLGTAPQVFGIPWPIGDQVTAWAINKTYGDWNGFRCYVDTIPPNPPDPERYVTHIAYHTAVDIPADSGTAVLAVFDGYVTAAKAFPDTQAYHGYITIARTLGGNPSWHYGHVIPQPALRESTFVSLGDTLGFVAPFRPNLSNCHLHFHLDEDVGNLTRSVCNPLDSLVPAPSQDVQFAQRTPVGRHKYEIEYVRDKRETIQLAQTLWDTTQQEYLLRDAVDVVVGAITVLEGNYDPGIYGIGYSVSPVDSGGTSPYRSMLVMRGPFEVADSLAYYSTFVDPEASPADWPLSRYIVTNCGDSIPSVTKGISNIEENCWPTRVDTSGTGQATRNEEARFPDGWYDFFLKAWSHSGDTAAVHDTVFVGNFTPIVNRALVRQTRGSRDSTTVYDAHWVDGELVVETEEPVRMVQGDVVEVELLFSESLHDTIRVTLEGPYAGLPFETVRWDSVVHPRDRWVGRYPLTAWDSIRNVMAGDRRLVIWAEDAVTRNALDSNPATAAYWDAEAEEWVGYEGDDGLPGQTGGHDRVHRLRIEPWVDLAIVADMSGSVYNSWAQGAIYVSHHLLDFMIAEHAASGANDTYRASLHRYWKVPGGSPMPVVERVVDMTSNLSYVQDQVPYLYGIGAANFCSNQAAPMDTLMEYLAGTGSTPRRMLWVTDGQINSGPWSDSQLTTWEQACADAAGGAGARVYLVAQAQTAEVSRRMARIIRDSGGAGFAAPSAQLYDDPPVSGVLYGLIRDEAARYQVREETPTARQSYPFQADPSMSSIIVLGSWIGWGMQLAPSEPGCAFSGGRGDSACCGDVDSMAAGSEAVAEGLLSEKEGLEEARGGGEGIGVRAKRGGERNTFQLYDAGDAEVPPTGYLGDMVYWIVEVDSSDAGEWELVVSGTSPFEARVAARSGMELALAGTRGVAAGSVDTVRVAVEGATLSSPDWALISADGAVYDADLMLYDDGAHGDGSANDNLWAATYAFPDSGSFRVLAAWEEDGHERERCTADAIKVYRAPEFVFVEPDGAGDSTGTSFWIKWEDACDLSATMALYYDDDDAGADGTLIAEGISEDSPVDSLKWDVFGVPEGSYYLYAVIQDPVNSPVTVYSSHPLTITAGHQAGWPAVTTGAVRASVVGVDLEADGSTLEVVAASYDSCVHVWDAAGVAKPGWPVRVVNKVAATPAVGDVDTTDAALEIVVGCWEGTGTLYCFNHDGTLVAGWPVNLGASIESAPTLADIDSDGELEVIVAAGSQVHVRRGDGSVQGGWPQTTDYWGVLYTSPAVADFDGDGYGEIAVCGVTTTMYLFEHTGAQKWTKTLQGLRVYAPLSAGDLDWDGVPEVIVHTWDLYNSQLYAYRGDGTTPTGWTTPKLVGLQARAGAAVGDLTGGGRLELVIGGGNNGRVHAYGSDGNPVSPTWGTGVQVGARTYAPAVLSDLDGDGTCEVVALATDIDKMMVLDAVGTTLPAWSRSIDGDTYGAPCVADLDLDGDTEILFGTDAGTVYCFDLPGAYRPVGQEYPKFQGDPGNTGRYREIVPPEGPEDLRIEAVAPDSLRIRWDTVRHDTLGRAEAVTAYRVYRGTAAFGVDGSVVAGEVAAPDTVFTEWPGTVENPSVHTFYRVTAEDQYGNESALSDETVGEFERNTGGTAKTPAQPEPEER